MSEWHRVLGSELQKAMSVMDATVDPNVVVDNFWGYDEIYITSSPSSLQLSAMSLNHVHAMRLVFYFDYHVTSAPIISMVKYDELREVIHNVLDSEKFELDFRFTQGNLDKGRPIYDVDLNNFYVTSYAIPDSDDRLDETQCERVERVVTNPDYMENVTSVRPVDPVKVKYAMKRASRVVDEIAFDVSTPYIKADARSKNSSYKIALHTYRPNNVKEYNEKEFRTLPFDTKFLARVTDAWQWDAQTWSVGPETPLKLSYFENSVDFSLYLAPRSKGDD